MNSLAAPGGASGGGSGAGMYESHPPIQSPPIQWGRNSQGCCEAPPTCWFNPPTNSLAAPGGGSSWTPGSSGGSSSGSRGAGCGEGVASVVRLRLPYEVGGQARTRGGGEAGRRCASHAGAIHFALPGDLGYKGIRGAVGLGYRFSV